MFAATGEAPADAAGRRPYQAGRGGTRAGGRLVPALWGLAAILAVAGFALTVGIRAHLVSAGDLVSNLGGALAGIYYATLGALVVRRAGNLIGWLLMGEGIALAAEACADAYAIEGLKGTRLPGAELAGLFGEWLFVPVIAGFLGTFLLFPDGRLPSPRWRPVGWFGIAVTGLALVGFLVHPRTVRLPAPGGVSASFPNPLAVTSLGPLASTLLVGTLTALTAASLPLFVAAVAALVARFRAGSREVREQIKWLAFLMAVLLVAQAVGLVGIASSGGSMDNPVTGVAYSISPVIALAGMPAVVTLAILKYRLYQIDVIINKTVKYALLSFALTAVYAAIVLGIGTAAGYAGGPALTVIAAVAVAVLFQPARSRAQLLANRLVYGRRATPVPGAGRLRRAPGRTARPGGRPRPDGGPARRGHRRDPRAGVGAGRG